MKNPSWKQMIGTTIGNWQILQRDYNPTSKQHSTFFKCKCLGCGQIFSISRDTLLSPKVKKLGCRKCAQRHNKVYNYPIGTQFGFLTTVSQTYTKNGGQAYVKCKCNCGNCSGQDILEIRVNHLLGKHHSKTISCGLAKISSGQLKIKNILDNNNIIYQQQYRIKDFNLYSAFDFAIFNQNGQLIKLIQYDGQQHFKPIQIWGGQQQLKIQQDRDRKKNQYCQTHGIKLLRIPYTQFDNISLEMLME